MNWHVSLIKEITFVVLSVILRNSSKGRNYSELSAFIKNKVS